MNNVVLVNRVSTMRDAKFSMMIPALQAAINDFALYWGSDCNATLSFCGLRHRPPKAAWKVWLLGHSDDPGALGYHEDDTGIPEAKIFVLDDLKYGASISVTIDHEIKEMLADPSTTRMGPTIGTREFIVEVADACEADEDGYLSHGVQVSDFVTPHYFGLPAPAGSPDPHRFDFCQRLKAPCPAMLPGGYLAYYDKATGQWTQITARLADGFQSYRSTKRFFGDRRQMRAANP